jgi:small subunit ribosomal protein S16
VAVKLRLKRMGKKKQPTYRIVVADTRSPRDGRFIEVIGTYAPRAEPSLIEVENARAVAWLTKGAKPSATVRKILEISGAWGEFTAARPAKAAKPARKKNGAAKKRAAAKAKRAKEAGVKKAGAKKAGAKKVSSPVAAAGEAPSAGAEISAPGGDGAETTVGDGGDA